MKFIHYIAKRYQQPQVEAIQYNTENLNDVIRFVGSRKASYCPLTQELWINTHIGDCIVKHGAYVVKRPEGMCYPVSECIFKKIYVEDVLSNDLQNK